MGRTSIRKKIRLLTGLGPKILGPDWSLDLSALVRGRIYPVKSTSSVPREW